MKVECDYCGGSTSKPPRKVKMNKRNFCDNVCCQRFYDKHDRTRDEKIKALLDYVANNQPVYARELAEELDINVKTIRNYLRDLRYDNKIKAEENGSNEYVYLLNREA